MVFVGDHAGVVVDGDSTFGPGDAAITAPGLRVHDLPGLDAPFTGSPGDDVSDFGPTVELEDGSGGGVDGGLFRLVSRRRWPIRVAVGTPGPSREDQERQDSQQPSCLTHVGVSVGGEGT